MQTFETWNAYQTKEAEEAAKRRNNVKEKYEKLYSIVYDVAKENGHDTDCVYFYQYGDEGLEVDLWFDNAQKILPYLKALSFNGFGARKDWPNKDDPERSLRKYWRNNNILIELHISGQSCKWVETEEMVPKKKLVCDKPMEATNETE